MCFDEYSHPQSKQIPVVAASGNSSSQNGISWPACAQNVIKAGAVPNDGFGVTISSFTNFGNPANYIGPFLLAPGGDGTDKVLYSSIYSAISTSDTAVIGLAGTFQAAPHIAGYYAAIKAAVPGISVDDATSWIITQGSITISANGWNFYRILIPNL